MKIRPILRDLAVLVQQMPKILALDQSSHVSGFSIFENGKLVKFGKFEFNDKDMGARLSKIVQKVKSLISEENIDELIIEDIQLQRTVGDNVATFKILAEVIGVLYEMAYDIRIPISSVLASVWKSKLNIKGKDRSAQKKAAQEYVQTNFGIKATQDECDAICIGTYACNGQVEMLSWE